MLCWQIGRVKITRVVESVAALPFDPDAPFMPDARPEALRAIAWLYPDFVTEDGALLLSVHALLVEAPGLRLVVDTCLGEGRDQMPDRDAPAFPEFIRQLEQAGWPRHSVDAVLCTHLHFDHVGWNSFPTEHGWQPTFPNARYLFGRTEFEHWAGLADAGVDAVLNASIRPILEAGLAELVETDHRISPEIRLIPTLGHTPGHVSVLIESEGETAVITGDMAHHPCQLARPHWSTAYDSDMAAAVSTRLQMFSEWSDRPILVIGTHFAGRTAGYLKGDKDTFRLDCDGGIDSAPVR